MISMESADPIRDAEQLAAWYEAGVRLIGILSRWEYNDLIGGDADMADLFTRIEIKYSPRRHEGHEEEGTIS